MSAHDSSAGVADATARRSAGSAAGGFRIGAVDLQNLCVAMSSPNGGVQVRDRVFRLSRYRDCFVGSEAIDWICAELDIGREQALRLGQRLVSNGMVRHVLNEHDFEDGYLFYTFVPTDRGVSAAAIEDSVMAAIDMTQLAWDLLGSGGVRVAVHRHRFIRYPDCFVGSELVDWISRRHHVSRQTALRIGRLLLERNLIRHVFDEQDLHDGRYFYRFA